MEIIRGRKQKLCMSQEKYVDKVLERFNMKNGKPISNLLATHFRLSAMDSPKSKVEVDYMSRVPYSNTIHCIIYTMVCTHLDIDQAVCHTPTFSTQRVGRLARARPAFSRSILSHGIVLDFLIVVPSHVECLDLTRHRPS